MPLSSLQCAACGKTYTAPRFLTAHERQGCQPSKRALRNILETTKSLWEARKRRRVEETSLIKLSDTAPTNGGATADLGSGTRLCMPGEPLDESQPLRHSSADTTANTSRIGATAVNPSGSRTRATRFFDEPPAPYASLKHPEVDPSSQPEPVFRQHIDEHTDPPTLVLSWHSTDQNSFGFIRSYYSLEQMLSDHDADASSISSNDLQTTLPPSLPQFGPFQNLSSFELAEWFWTTGGILSLNNFSQLVSVLNGRGFSTADIASTNWRKAFDILASNRDELPGEEGDWIDDDGWYATEVAFDVPYHSRMKNSGTETYIAGKLHHRRIVSVIREALSNPSRSRRFHFKPYKLSWRRHPSADDVNVQGELYTSPAFLQAHEELQNSPSEPGCTLERVIVGLMFWSDGTVLTSFGGSKLWPCYMYFGNESKLRRVKVSEHLGEHIAYFEELGGAFKDYLKDRGEGKSPPDSFIAFCHRLMFQAQWDVLLDEELTYAMQHGIVIRCHDGIERRFYPRIFTYSADYPEKASIATIRKHGTCPCPRCKVPSSEFGKTGMHEDQLKRQKLQRNPFEQQALVQQAQQMIFGSMRAVTSEDVEKLLKAESWTPVVNVFTSKLGADKFDIFSTLVVDLLHDFEIGVWKSLFLHLIRILDSSSTRKSGPLLSELNYRYRHMPTFGRDTIRKFGSGVSDGKRRAARDFEDLLQCAIPAFEGLIPDPHSDIVQKLLYLCAQWHALAKLRLHNDLTLRKLENTTVLMTDQFRIFVRDTCSKIVAYELKSEQDARNRRNSRANGNGKNLGKVKSSENKSSDRQRRQFSLQTYKFHAIGDYVHHIRRFGTTDSFSTEVGERGHCDPKAWFGRTNKKDYSVQIARIERRRARLRSIRAKVDQYQREHAAPDPDGVEPTQHIPTSAHYIMGTNQNSPHHLMSEFGTPSAHRDPALHRFVPKLKAYLFSVLEASPQPSPHRQHVDWTTLTLEHGRIYSHKILRVRYTTYDVRRAEDVIHTESDQSNVMVVNPDFKPDSCKHHPFRYARVLGIYHARPYLPGWQGDASQPKRVDFMWVRWYDTVSHGHAFELDRLQLCPAESPNAFGFLDPSEIVRAVHLPPQFSKGVAANPSPRWFKGTLWRYYFVNRFCDRDMFMRFLWGLAIGHTYTWKDQQEDPSYFAKLENLLQSSFNGSTQPEIPSAKVSPAFAPSARTGVLAPVFSWTDTGVQEGNPLDLDEDGCGTDLVEDNDWEDLDYDGDGQEDIQDEWDLRDDDEVLAYDEMYEDWYLR